jgi:hypothetical protein
LIADAESWSHHVARLLRNWLSSEEIALEFASPGGGDPVSYRERDIDSATPDDILEQITVLDTLMDRLESYAIPVPSTGAIGIADSPVQRPPPSALSYVTYKFTGTVGQLIAGEGQTVSNINGHIAAMMSQGEPQVGAALQRLAEITLSDPELDQRTRAEVLETIEDLAEAAEAEPQGRKGGRIKGAIAVITAAAGAATQLGQAWQQRGPMITQHLRLPSP